MRLKIRVFGHVDIIYEIDALGVYELRIAPGAAIPPHYHRKMDEAELILDQGVMCQSEILKPGIAHFWPKKPFIPIRIRPKRSFHSLYRPS